MRNGYPLIDEIPMPTVDDAFCATMLGFLKGLVHTESAKEKVEAPFHFTNGLFVISDEGTAKKLMKYRGRCGASMRIAF